MSGGRTVKILRNISIGVAMPMGAQTAVANDKNNAAMTAGTLVDSMKPSERYTYVAGIIDGLAYARFRNDTAAKGSRFEDGMKCIYDWFFNDDQSFDTIDAAFKKYPQHLPSTLVAVLTKKACGE